MILFFRIMKEKLDSELNEFRDEIRRIRDEEISGKRGTAHLFKSYIDDKENPVDIANLTERDYEIWSKLKNKTLNKEEFEKYRTGIEETGSDRYQFAMFVGNLLTTDLLKKGKKRE